MVDRIRKKGERSDISVLNGEFLDFVDTNPGLLEASQFGALDLNDELFVLQPWPTFVNHRQVERFKEASVTLFKLLKSIPKRLFGYNSEKISRYYNIPKNLAQLQLEGVTDDSLRNIVGRGDFLMGESGLKCLEYNVSAALGGWHLPLWESLYFKIPLITKFLQEKNIKISNDNLIQHFVEHLVEAILRKSPNPDTPAEANILLVLRDFEIYIGEMGEYLNHILQLKVLPKYPNLAGEVMVCDYHHLDVSDGHVYFNGKRIQALIEIYNGMVAPDVMEVFKNGNLCLINGPMTEFLSNKLNMELLSDYNKFGDNVFSAEEKHMIDMYVPWSRKLVRGNTTYNGQEINLVTFVINNKDRLVLKPSVGFGGQDIYIGHRISQTKWEDLVEKALDSKLWLIQEFISSTPALYQDGDRGCTPHDRVWGFFVLGERFGGSWVRVMPQKNNKGVINCHQGAKVSVVFQVDE